MTLTIRPARLEDAGTLLALVGALAEYERAPEAAVATVEDFQRRGPGGEKPLFDALVAEEEGEAIGFALYFLTFSTWTGRPTLYLEDLFVRPERRGRGAGRALFEEVAKIAVEKGCARFDFQVLDWNQSAIDFYVSLGARPRREWIPFRVEGEALESLARGARRAGEGGDLASEGRGGGRP
jgi:GNAT superfamily N-acetyltransferase